MSNRQDAEPGADRSDDGDGTSADGDGASAADGEAGPPDAGPDLPAPRPGRSPESVIRTVLSALETNDDPVEDAGVRTAFNLSAPGFRARAGGSLAAFRDTLTGPINRALVDHQEARRGDLRVEGEAATEKVVVVDSDGDASTYEFGVEKQSEGKYEGCWMVTGIDLVYVGVAPDHRHMPVVEFDGVEVKCEVGDDLRDVLLRASGVSPHNAGAQYANCNGNGVCGTCAVVVEEGEVTGRTAQEKRRLRLPPHSGTDDPNYRLACQAQVRSDLVVSKHEGFWGQHVEEYAEGTEEDPDGDPIRVTDEEYEGTDGATAGADPDPDDGGDLDLSDEARDLLAETRRLLDGEGDGGADGDDGGADDDGADGTGA